MKRMKWLLLPALLLLSSTSFGQNWWKNAIRGEGEIVERDLKVDDFDGITLAFSGDVFIEQGDIRSVRVEGQENIIENIQTTVEGRHWRIRYDRPVRNSKPVKVYITMPTLEAARVSGSGNIVSKGEFTGLEDLAVSVSGSGDIRLDVQARGTVDSQISGSGTIVLSGNSGAIEVGVSGSGDVRAEELTAEQGRIQISGSGDAEVHVTGELEVRISGSGDVNYKGSPRLRSKVSGSGDVNGV